MILQFRSRLSRQSAQVPWDLGSDEDFDALYPARWQAVSKRYWTPVAVASLAAAWLTEDPRLGPVLDIGSGVGKFCIVGALGTGGEFVGVEQRGALVRASRASAMSAGVSARATFHHARASMELLRRHSAFYLFNPFAENLYEADGRLDDRVELSDRRFTEDLQLVEEALSYAKLGTRVVTYHGFGGSLPSGFVLGRVERIGSDALCLWIRKR